jgi:hypothetical protein
MMFAGKSWTGAPGDPNAKDVMQISFPKLKSDLHNYMVHTAPVYSRGHMMQITEPFGPALEQMLDMLQEGMWEDADQKIPSWLESDQKPAKKSKKTAKKGSSGATRVEDHATAIEINFTITVDEPIEIYDRLNAIRELHKIFAPKEKNKSKNDRLLKGYISCVHEKRINDDFDAEASFTAQRLQATDSGGRRNSNSRGGPVIIPDHAQPFPQVSRRRQGLGARQLQMGERRGRLVRRI